MHTTLVLPGSRHSRVGLVFPWRGGKRPPCPLAADVGPPPAAVCNHANSGKTRREGTAARCYLMVGIVLALRDSYAPPTNGAARLQRLRGRGHVVDNLDNGGNRVVGQGSRLSE